MYAYIVTIQYGGIYLDVTTRAKNPSQAMANVVSQYRGALVVRVK